MKCPDDGVEMTLRDRHGVGLEFCPVCRGIWLSRADVEKLIVQAGADCRPSPVARPPRFGHDDDRQVHRRRASVVAEILDD
jgi:Zn-finger nucleic acid-binding protein